MYGDHGNPMRAFWRWLTGCPCGCSMSRWWYYNLKFDYAMMEFAEKHPNHFLTRLLMEKDESC